jgi:hypothetical protein
VFLIRLDCAAILPDVSTSSLDVRFSAISYVALLPDGFNDTSKRGTLEG